LKIKNIFLFVVIVSLIFSFSNSISIKANVAKDFYSNYYIQKIILNEKIKIILNNHSIFILLFLKNIDKNSISIENKLIDDLFNNFSSIFNFSYNDQKFINDLLNKYDLESFKNLTMISLSNYIKVKNIMPNIPVKIDNYEINRIQKEVDIFINNNPKIIDNFYEKLFKIIEDEFQKYFSFLNQEGISYFSKIADKTIYCVDFFITGHHIGGLAESSESYESYTLIYLRENLYSNYCVFIHENIHTLFYINKFSDQINKLLQDNNLICEIDKLLKTDENNDFYYNYRGFKILLKSKEDFYFRFIYIFFNEFFAHTFSSFILKLIYNENENLIDNLLFISKDRINEDPIMKNIYELQNYLISNKNSIYYIFLKEEPNIEQIYKLFLLFLYSHPYNLDQVLNKVII